MTQTVRIDWTTALNTVGFYIVGFMLFFVMASFIWFGRSQSYLPYLFGIAVAAAYLFYHGIGSESVRRFRSRGPERFSEDGSQSPTDESIDSFKSQYVSGSISEAEFEDRIEELLSDDSASVSAEQVEAER